VTTAQRDVLVVTGIDLLAAGGVVAALKIGG
jgi:hypothetical protein